jgi:hypothetical protein
MNVENDHCKVFQDPNFSTQITQFDILAKLRVIQTELQDILPLLMALTLKMTTQIEFYFYFHLH